MKTKKQTNQYHSL